MPAPGPVLRAVLLAACILPLPGQSHASTDASSAWQAARNAILNRVGPSSLDSRSLAGLSSMPPKGTIVTLSRAGKTRACQGSLHPEAATQRDETVRVAHAAAAGDPRHPVIQPSEIPHLLLRVSLVRLIESIPAPNGLNPSRDGLWLRGGGAGEKNAIILPGEARTASYMANEALRRAGIRAGETVEWFRLDIDWHEAPIFPTTSHSGGQ